MAYGPDNRIQSFKTINAFTRTDKPGMPAPPPMLTQSKELLATFDPKTSELVRLEQKTISITKRAPAAPPPIAPRLSRPRIKSLSKARRVPSIPPARPRPTAW